MIPYQSELQGSTFHLILKLNRNPPWQNTRLNTEHEGKITWAYTTR